MKLVDGNPNHVQLHFSLLIRWAKAQDFIAHHIQLLSHPPSPFLISALVCKPQLLYSIRSDSPDHLLASLLHALTVSITGSRRRKRLAESIFARLASKPGSGSNSVIPAGIATNSSGSVSESSSTPLPATGLIWFLYQGCLFPPAHADSDETGAISPPRVSTRDADRSAWPGGIAGAGAGIGAGVGAASSTAAAAVAESSLGPRCKKRETRRAAFALLAAMCQGEEAHLRQTLALLGGRDLVDGDALESQSEGRKAFGSDVPEALAGSSTETVPNSGTGEPGGGSSGAQDASTAEEITPIMGEQPALGSGEPWDYDPTSVLKESGQHVGLQNQVRGRPIEKQAKVSAERRLVQWPLKKGPLMSEVVGPCAVLEYILHYLSQRKELTAVVCKLLCCRGYTHD